MENKALKRGQLFMVDLGEVNEYSGSLQKGLRPCILISNEMACRYSPILTVVPLTTRYTKKPIPTHYYIAMDGQNRLRRDSIVLCEQIITVNRASIKKHTGELSSKDMFEVNKCLGISMGLSLAF